MKTKDGKNLIINEDSTLTSFGFNNIYNESVESKEKKKKKDTKDKKQDNK